MKPRPLLATVLLTSCLSPSCNSQPSEPLGPPDDYTLTVHDGIVDVSAGLSLDGELADPADPEALPSGDGLPGGDAVVRLMDASCSQQRLKVAGLDWVIAAVGRVPSYELVYSRLDEAVAAVCEVTA